MSLKPVGMHSYHLCIALSLLIQSLHGGGNHGNNPNDVAKEYVIEIAVKFSDGGEIQVKNAVELGGKILLADTVLTIEQVLKEANGIQGVKFVETKITDENWVKEVKEGGTIHFAKPVEHISIPNGHGKKTTVVPFHFKWPANGNVRIFEFVEQLGRIDPRWHRRESDVEGCHKKCRHAFMPRQNGHSMVVLSERIPKKKGGGGGEDKFELREVARFHFDKTGLNLFIKSEKKNYVIGEKDSKEGEEGGGEGGGNAGAGGGGTNVAGRVEEIRQRDRGIYKKQGFPTGHQMVSRKLSLDELKQIALNVVAGRAYIGAEFNCGHFVYEFIQSIVPAGQLTPLKQFPFWPETIRLLDQHSGQRLDKIFAFAKSVPFDYNEWVEKHQKASAEKDGKNEKAPEKMGAEEKGASEKRPMKLPRSRL